MKTLDEQIQAVLNWDHGYTPSLEMVCAIIKTLEESKMRCSTDPVTRLHNICDGLSEQRNESPYSKEAWDAQDEAYQKLCVKLKGMERERDEATDLALEKAILRCEDEFLVDPTELADDVAYNIAVRDCVEALKRLKSKP